MSFSQQLGDYFRDNIYNITHSIFSKLGFELDKNKIYNDLAQSLPDCIKCTFYVTDIDNVKRKEFNELVTKLKEENQHVIEFKVKFKRPEKPVRFYLHLNKEIVQ